MFLLTVSDKHTDPEYSGFKNVEYALEVADDALVDTMKHYGLSESEVDIYPCDGSDGWWLSAQSHCGSFSITVRYVKVV